MSIIKRLIGIDKKMDLIGIDEPPDFDKMSNDELDKYIRESLEREHKENVIINFNEAEAHYNSLLSKNLISRDEHKLFIQAEKEYWEK